MKRIQQILAATLIVQIIIGVLVFWPRGADANGGEPVLPNLEPDNVVAITITDDQNNILKLRKENGSWGLVESDQYPVKADTVSNILEKLAHLDSSTLVARSENSQRQLQVASDTYLRRIDLTMQDETQYSIYLGSAPRYTATHFRVAGQLETYLTTEISTWEVNATPNSWIDTLYTEIEQSTLTEVTLDNQNGVFTFIKDEESGNWILPELLEGDKLAMGKVNSVISKACRVTMLRPLGKTELPDYGLDTPQATVTLTSPEGTYTLYVGAKTGFENAYVVKSSEADYYVAVAEYGVKPLIENTYEDFLDTTEETSPPTP